VKDTEEMKVIDLLLEFSKLEKKERELFLENMNRYIFVSPSGQRKLRVHWETKTKNSTSA
jgi:hypothetical protein